MKCSLGISNFLEEISSLSHSIAFLYFFALITEEGFLISPCYSLELCIQMAISFLFSLPMAQMVKNLPAVWETWVPSLGQEGNGNKLQYSCQENSMNREAWQATVYGVATSWT